MKGDPESFSYLEQLYHDEVDITHHLDALAAQRLVDSYRHKFLKRMIEEATEEN